MITQFCFFKDNYCVINYIEVYIKKSLLYIEVYIKKSLLYAGWVPKMLHVSHTLTKVIVCQTFPWFSVNLNKQEGHDGPGSLT